jgi:predicted ATP-dependent serine protease
MLKFADMCGKIGNVLYVLAEEKLESGTVQKRERHAKVNLAHVTYIIAPTFEQLSAALATGKYQFVIIDSVNMMETDQHPADQIMHLWDQHRIVHHKSRL